MKKDKDILSQLKKTKKPIVPESFFNEFEINITSQIKNETILNHLKKTDKPKVKSDFFKNFPNNITNSVAPSAKVGVIPLKFFITITSAAAALIVYLFVFNTTKPTKVANHNAQNNYINTNVNKTKSNNKALNNETSFAIKSDEVLYVNDVNTQTEEDLIFAEFEAEMDDFYYDL